MLTLHSIIFNGIGVIGVILCLIGFLFLQIGKFTGDQLAYILLNLFGSLGILISLIYDWNLASFLVEFAWLVISLFGLINFYLKQRHG